MNVSGRIRSDTALDTHTLDSAPKAAVPSALRELVLEKLGFEAAVVVELDYFGRMRQAHFANQTLALSLAVVALAVGTQAAVDLQKIGQISFQSLSVEPEK